jgi:hypothetical protein
LIDGGWLLPQGQESALSPLVKVFRRLPAEAFQTVKLSDQPRELIVRTLVGTHERISTRSTLPWPGQRN